MLLNLDNVGFYVLLKLNLTYVLVIYELSSSKLKIKDTSSEHNFTTIAEIQSW